MLFFKAFFANLNANFLLIELTVDFVLAISTSGCGERSVALNNVVDLSSHLESVNVLCVVAQQLALELEFFYEHVRERRSKLAWIDLLGELKERPRIVLEVENVEHGLWVGKIRKVDAQTGIDTVTRAKVRYTARNRTAGACQYDDVVTVLDEVKTVIDGVELEAFLSWRQEE